MEKNQTTARIAALLALLLTAAQLYAHTPTVKTGIDMLQERNFDILKGRHVGLITNPSGVDASLRSTVDILFRANGAYSVYGATRKPTPEMLKGIDLLVYDIQDIGCRSYTYISTLGFAMEAAAEQHIPFVVLDRPDPLGGQRIEGNIVEEGFKSFISPYPIPYVYGLTCGELAQMLNGEGILANHEKCDLTVIPMKGWKRSMTFEQTGLQWVPTSPHVPFSSSPLYYVSTGVMGELGVISEGVGYTMPFHLFGAEWIDPGRLSGQLAAMKIPGVIFRPMSYRPFYGRLANKDLGGVQICITDPSAVNLMSLQFLLMEAHNKLYPSKNPMLMADSAHRAAFDKAVGTNVIRFRFAKRMMYEDIKSYLEKDVDSFRKTSKKYWLY
jgi:uncharacterized protein YbbC (DUF1343 family)